jgi:hypothetical protein
MRVRKGLWSLRRGSAVPPRSADHPSFGAIGLVAGPRSPQPPTAAVPCNGSSSPGARGAVAARGPRSRDPLRVSSAAAHAVMARFL